MSKIKLCVFFVTLFASLAYAAQNTRAPYKVLFSNDFTNNTSCITPYHQKGQKWTPEVLAASIDETAGYGIDVHMLQPAHGWVPWWPSKVYPLEEHYKWWIERYTKAPEVDIQDYILGGGDPCKEFVERSRQGGMHAFISLRMNDVHHFRNVNKTNYNDGAHAICRFYAEHPEYRLGKAVNHGNEAAMNWGIQEVRDHKFSYVKEICELYDLDGFEMDFMRHPWLFKTNETTSQQRKDIMVGFVKKVRRLLDDTSRDGKYRWLCVRIPVWTDLYDDMGIDLKLWTEAGVDMINASATFFTVNVTDIAEITKVVPETPVYFELCHTTMNGKRLTKKGGDDYNFRRTTDEQYYTAAHLAYSRGASGISLFNFVYYRQHGRVEDHRGPFNEPPFHIIKNLGRPDILTLIPQHYVIAEAYETPYMPLNLKSGETGKIILDMAPPQSGWKKVGTLRIQSEGLMGDSEFEAKINGTLLSKTSELKEPYGSPYTPMLGVPEILRGWKVPFELLNDGPNAIEVTMIKGNSAKIVFADLAIE